MTLSSIVRERVSSSSEDVPRQSSANEAQATCRIYPWKLCDLPETIDCAWLQVRGNRIIEGGKNVGKKHCSAQDCPLPAFHVSRRFRSTIIETRARICLLYFAVYDVECWVGETTGRPSGHSRACCSVYALHSGHGIFLSGP